MFEMLLSSGKAALKSYPKSGPGIKTLKAGNETIGYFGLVSGSELFQGSDISAKVNLQAGLAFNDTNTQWMKFIYNGKFLFIAQQPIRRNLSWNDVYSAGAMYGVKGPGPYPMPGNPVDQYPLMIKYESTTAWKFVVRTISGATEPFNPSDTNALKLATGNEHNDLLYRMVDVAGLPNTGVFEKNAYTLLSPSTATATILKETSSTNVLNGSVRMANGTTLVGAKNTPQATDAAWRPVLELLDDDLTVYDPYFLYPEYPGARGPLTVAGTSVDYTSNPVQLIADDQNTIKATHMQSVAIVDPVQWPKNLYTSFPISPVTMTFART